ncbi:TetR/AcrR family transcriptional regulator [Actinomadura barringtoniae]|uniref:TetR/AcrR family transcriptional regulator n=1 Tax=Actinomadura barringtoniae TaxID=1427535 RepID=A0A939T6E9_9ACTN|nr:TetR/AcrR family transcriptional regulator [Actinomadura barringtoniae]MBO2454851.1 TetR/AcrR family transcriptional regulator [Actinomadura barringtoniae]
MSPRRAAALRGGDVSLRDHLIATAERMIAERGSAGLTVRAIAREAGVADGVLYNHFSDKEELLAHALNAHVGSVERTLGDLPEPGTATVAENLHTHIEHGLALHRAILPAMAGFLSQPEVLARFSDMHGNGTGDWRDRLRDYLHTEQELGRLASDAKVDAAASMIVGVCHETVLGLLFQAIASPPAPERLDDLITAVLDGIGLR